MIDEAEPPGLTGLGEADMEEEAEAVDAAAVGRGGGGLGDREEGDLGRRAEAVLGWLGEVEVELLPGGSGSVADGGVRPAVREALSQGERGSRLNQWPLFSVSTRNSWSLGKSDGG